MKDFSFWKEYEGTSEGSGRSEKIWLQNPDTGQTGLFKFKKDAGTTDHISECIAYKIAKLLELPCAKFELGMYQGREGSISYNIIEKPTQNLIEGIYFITLIYPGYNPLYDNSSSLCAYISEDQVENYLGRDKNRWKALVDTKSKSLLRCNVCDEKRPTHLNVLKYIKENYFTETREFAKKISAAMLEEQIRDILKQYSTAELSDNKKRLIFEFLLAKKQMLEEVYMGEDE